MSVKVTANTSGSPPTRRSPAAALMLIVLVLAVLLWRLAPTGQTTQPAPAPTSLVGLLTHIERGEPDAVARAKDLAAREWPRCLPDVGRMLSHANWRVRAAACRILADRPDRKWAGVLLPRASDADWRVRAAALAALARFGAVPASASLRDTPLDQRERLLLDWLADFDARGGTPLGADLCEVYAGAAHLEFGRPIAQRCLSCHAGASPAPFNASGACAGCHRQIHDDWGRSAHAQSVSHLDLTTIDPTSRSPRRMAFGEVRGLSCVECHTPGGATRPAATRPAATRPAATGPAGCPFGFRSALPARGACARCHAVTHRQWLAWRQGRQPRRAKWPPGQITLDARGDQRHCVDCHMPPVPLAAGREVRDHRWAARRNVALLREGIHVELLRPGLAASERRYRLSVTNLSGHGYPTGSRRRAVRILAGPADRRPLPCLATLSPPWPGPVPTGALPALAPGERRTFAFSIPTDAPAVAYRLVYCRNLLRPDAYKADILAAEARLGQ